MNKYDKSENHSPNVILKNDNTWKLNTKVEKKNFFFTREMDTRMHEVNITPMRLSANNTINVNHTKKTICDGLDQYLYHDVRLLDWIIFIWSI